MDELEKADNGRPGGKNVLARVSIVGRGEGEGLTDKSIKVGDTSTLSIETECFLFHGGKYPFCVFDRKSNGTTGGFIGNPENVVLVWSMDFLGFATCLGGVALSFHCLLAILSVLPN
jgi:hypothetical protein